MPEKLRRIVLVGAGTLLGKALNDELAVSLFASADFRLIDDEDAQGKLAAVADEVTFIQRIEPDSFVGADFTFFAGSRELTKKYWRQALQSGSIVIDLSGELEEEQGILVRAPWIQNWTHHDPSVTGRAQSDGLPSTAPDLQTRAVVAAHPVAVLLALLYARSRTIGAIHGLWATLLQPASEYGHAALEELHHQTTNLLSFQPLPTEVFGGQAAFTLAISFGTEGQANLATAARVIERHYAKIVPAAASLALQVVQVPVFHGYALSVAIEFSEPVAADALTQALAGPQFHIVPTASDFPGNVQAVEEEDVQILIQPVISDLGSDTSGSGTAESANTNRFWLWVVADNLKFAAKNAVACALELDCLRPRGGVQ